MWKVDMTICCVEMRVARNDITALHEVAEKNVLGSTALVSRNDILESCNLIDCFLKLEER